MKKYKILVEGSNFLIRMDEKIGRYGFFTTRFVVARDLKDAEAFVMELIRSELESQILNEQSNPPLIHIEEIIEIEDFGENLAPSTGFTWYMMEEENYHGNNRSGSIN